jgi:ketosteroid isomerase-like protein
MSIDKIDRYAKSWSISQMYTNYSIMFSALFQEIKTRQAEFMRYFNAGNAAAAAEIYDPDGYFMPHGRDPVKGRAGITRQYLSYIECLFQESKLILSKIWPRVLRVYK